MLLSHSYYLNYRYVISLAYSTLISSLISGASHVRQLKYLKHFTFEEKFVVGWNLEIWRRNGVAACRECGSKFI